MEEGERKELKDQSVTLRQELKVWEREFAAANDGRKAGREDIKHNPHIAQKYKDYNRVRDILAGKLPLPRTQPKKSKSRTQEATSPRPSKRKSPSNTHGTPSKRRAVTESHTPSQRHPHLPITGQFNTPSANRLLFTPQKPRVIGPTPQKDGKFLGIFDAMPSGDEESPFKQPPPAPADAPSIQDTPQKKKEPGDGIMATPTVARHSRTPLSSSKRFLLDTFVTPLKRRRTSNDGSAKRPSLTPSSVSKLNLSTPAFLRRDSRANTLAAISETTTVETSPPAARLPKRSLVRGLSSILASLREMQEEALDEDLEVLREMESGPPPPNAAQKQTLPKPQTSKAQEQVQVEDSQQLSDFPFIDFPDLNFNNDGKEVGEELTEKEQAMVDRDSKLPIYKKKGQKRTTRKVNLKPVRTKAPAKKAEPISFSDDEDDEHGTSHDDTLDRETQNTDLVPDTQQGFDADSLPLYKAERNFDSGSDNSTEYTASEGGTRYKRSKTKMTGRKTKVGARAHMNYKRMKLRNTGAKGGKVGGRFGRRR